MSLRETAAGASSPEAVLLTITSAARRRDIGFESDLPTPLRRAIEIRQSERGRNASNGGTP